MFTIMYRDLHIQTAEDVSSDNDDLPEICMCDIVLSTYLILSVYNTTALEKLKTSTPRSKDVKSGTDIPDTLTEPACKRKKLMSGKSLLSVLYLIKENTYLYSV